MKTPPSTSRGRLPYGKSLMISTIFLLFLVRTQDTNTGTTTTTGDTTASTGTGDTASTTTTTGDTTTTATTATSTTTEAVKVDLVSDDGILGEY